MFDYQTVRHEMVDRFDGSDTCICHRCISEKNLTGEKTGSAFWDSIPLSSKQMIVCPTCGNKRCPHASDHDLACTDSNEPGQIGSIYS